MSSCPSHCLISSLPISFNLLTPCILLIMLIWVACTLLCCCSVRLHTSQPYNNEDIIVALTTYSQFCAYIAPSFSAPTHSSNHTCNTHNPCLHFLLHPAILQIITPEYFISTTCSITNPHFTISTLLCYLITLVFFHFKSHLSIASLNACKWLCNPLTLP